eukprot:787979-Pyramimonas_sp.AAC.1
MSRARLAGEVVGFWVIKATSGAPALMRSSYDYAAHSFAKGVANVPVKIKGDQAVSRAWFLPCMPAFGALVIHTIAP